MVTVEKKLTYRLGSISDKKQLMHIGIVSFGQYFNILTKENVEKLSKSLHDESKLLDLIGMSKIFVCCHGDKIVGAAYFIPSGNPWDVFKAEWSYIRMVGVDPAYQGNGIGKTLTEMCLEEAKASGEKIVALHTSEIMNAARHIYESLGFKVLYDLEPRLGVKYWLYTLQL